MSDEARTAFKVWACEAMPTSGVASVFHHLCCDASDDDFSCDPTEEELARVTGQGVSTVRRHLVWLADERWITRERRRNPDQTWTSVRTFLNAEKLKIGKAHRPNWAVARNAPQPVDKPVDNDEGATAQPTARSTAQFEQPPLDPPPISEAAVEDARPRAPVLPSLPSFSFPGGFFKTEEDKAYVERILAACGPRVHRPVSTRLLDSLVERLETWRSSFDLDLDVLPVVRKQTERRRKAALLDVKVIEPDIWAHREARRRGFGRAPSQPKDPAQGRAEGLRNLITQIDAGNYPPRGMLPAEERKLAGADLTAAYKRLRMRSVDELGQIEAAMAQENA